MKKPKVKIISISISESKQEITSLHYAKMGFELLSSTYNTVKNESGNVINTYYENIYKFDFGQRNAEQLWEIYKKYLKKKGELENAYSKRRGDFVFTKSFLPIFIISSVVSFPFFPMLFGNDFGEFISWKIGLLSSYKSFDSTIFFGSLALAPIFGFVLSLIVQLILYAFTYKNRILTSVDIIPVLEKEIEDLTSMAQHLRNQ